MGGSGIIIWNMVNYNRLKSLMFFRGNYRKNTFSL